MCIRPKIYTQCCDRAIDWDLAPDRHFPSWSPPIFENCDGAMCYNSETHYFVDRDFGHTLWSTYPIACNQCERSCIRSTQNSSEVRAAIDQLINGMVKKGLRLDQVGRKQTLRVARDFFRAAYENRLIAGVYMRDSYTKMMAWRSLLDQQGALLLLTDMKSPAPPREGLDMSMEVLRSEAASLKQEIAEDTVTLVRYFLGQRWGAHGHFETHSIECRTLSLKIGNLREKYWIFPGNGADHVNDDPAWGLDDQDPENWY